MAAFEDVKLIVVFGATGAQGNGLVRAICADEGGGYRARVVTRNPESVKSRALAALGAEVVQADAYAPVDVERVLAGAYGAFFVTWSFEPSPNPEKEIAQVKSYAEASKKVGLKHAIFSTTEDTSKFVPLDSTAMPTIDGKWKVPHFEAKGGSEHFFEQACVPATYLRAGFYYENLLTLFPPTMGEDGKYAFTIPLGDKQIAWISADDIGRCAYGIFKGGASKYGGHQPASGEHMSLTELAAKFAEAFPGEGHEFSTNTFVTPAIFRTFGFPGCEALGNMFQFEHDFSDMYCFNRSMEKSREYNPALQGFSEWLAENKDKIPFVGEHGELKGS